MHHSSIFVYVVLLLVCFPTNKVNSADDQTLPNILLIYADDLGIGDIGCFGNDTIRTPSIDSIAAQGAKLTHHLTAAPVCTPSRAAFLTGRYPIRSGMASPRRVTALPFAAGRGGLPANETAFTELAKEKGYHTGIIGKWHLGMSCETASDYCHHPKRFGFDYFYGTIISNTRFNGDGEEIMTWLYAFNPSLWRGLPLTAIIGVLTSWILKRFGVLGNRGFCFLAVLSIVLPLIPYVLVRHWLWFNSMFFRNDEVVEHPVRFENMTKRLVREGLDFLEDHQKNHPNTPFLLFMSWLQVHTHLHTGKEFEGVSKHGPYGDNVEEMDWASGQILKGVERLGMKENTFVYFSSDNGGHLEETDGKGRRAGGHNGIYRGGKVMGGMDGGIRVPTTVMWPGKIRPGLVIDEPTSQMDMLPTIAEMVNVPVPQDRIIDGKSMLPLLTEKESKTNHSFLFHYCGVKIVAARYRSIKGNHVFKVHYAWPKWLPNSGQCDFACSCPDHHPWLETPVMYDIANDPSEKTPLDITIPKYAKVLEKINQAKKEHMDSIEQVEYQQSFSNTVYRPWLQVWCPNGLPVNCIDPKFKDKVEIDL